MALNDFLKKAKETVAGVADAAKAGMNEQREKMAAEKAEKERIRAEKQAQADGVAKELSDALAAGAGNCLSMDSKTLLDFTADFYDKLYLPAHSVSSSKLIFHPLDKKINKYAQKDFAAYRPDVESPVFLILGKAGERIFLSTQNLYFKKALPDDPAFFSEGALPIGQIASMSYTQNGDHYVFTCNGVELMNTSFGFELDDYAFSEYAGRLENKDFTITSDQIDAMIKDKIGENVLKVVKEYVYDDERILYFAWGADSITAKDFVVCTDKQMVVLDREAFGLTKNVKQFYYEDVTSMATLQETNGLLDLALTAALSICDLEISVAGAKERLNTLFVYEAEKAVKVYRECRRNIKEGAKQPQVVVQQAAPAADDPLAQLEKLNKLKEMGVLSEEEFNVKKADLLAKI